MAKPSWGFVRVDTALLKRLKIRAAREQTSMAAITRKMLAAYLEQPISKPAP